MTPDDFDEQIRRAKIEARLTGACAIALVVMIILTLAWAWLT